MRKIVFRIDNNDSFVNGRGFQNVEQEIKQIKGLENSAIAYGNYNQRVEVTITNDELTNTSLENVAKEIAMLSRGNIIFIGLENN